MPLWPKVWNPTRNRETHTSTTCYRRTEDGPHKSGIVQPSTMAITLLTKSETHTHTKYVTGGLRTVLVRVVSFNHQHWPLHCSASQRTHTHTHTHTKYVTGRPNAEYVNTIIARLRCTIHATSYLSLFLPSDHPLCSVFKQVRWWLTLTPTGPWW